MLVVLALTSAAMYGAADFLGGLASRRASAIAIVVISQLSGLVALLLVLPLLPPSSPVRADWVWGAAAGVAGGVGVALLYRALAIGSMAVVAPITAVCAVTVPVAVSIALGERPATGTIAGIALALVSIVLVSQQRPDPTVVAVAQDFSPAAPAGSGIPARASGIGIAFASGVAIGLFFLALARTRADAGLWPLVAARSMSFGLFAVFALVTHRPMRVPSKVLTIAVAGGLLDMLANVLYLLASRYGPLSIVVTLSSLYPASTVLLARTVLGERLSAIQITGIVCALAAVLLIVGTR
jgi:drug/metabolite transporter (DMT)-like permease